MMLQVNDLQAVVDIDNSAGEVFQCGSGSNLTIFTGDACPKKCIRIFIQRTTKVCHSPLVLHLIPAAIGFTLPFPVFPQDKPNSPWALCHCKSPLLYFHSTIKTC